MGDRVELPAITRANASAYPPPDLRLYRTMDVRTADCAPALWYKQMTGSGWDGSGHSYDLEKKRHRRMLPYDSEYKVREHARDRQRDRSKRIKQIGNKSSYTKEERRVYKARRREEARPELERARAEAAAARAQLEAEREERAQAYETKRLDMERLFITILEEAGIESPRDFVESAYSCIDGVSNLLHKGWNRDRTAAYRQWVAGMNEVAFIQRLLMEMDDYVDASDEHEAMHNRE